MTVQTGRTTKEFLQFIIGDAGNGTLRRLAIDSISALGHQFDETDLTAWMDAVKTSLPGIPGAPLDITGQWSTIAAAAVPSESGSHTILQGIKTSQLTTITPLTLDVRLGIRHVWEAGEPQFGLTGTATSGYWLKNYTYDPSTNKFSAQFRLFPGSSLPDFGTAAETT